MILPYEGNAIYSIKFIFYQLYKIIIKGQLGILNGIYEL